MTPLAIHALQTWRPEQRFMSELNTSGAAFSSTSELLDSGKKLGQVNPRELEVFENKHEAGSRG